MKKVLAIFAVIASLLAWGSQIDDPLNDNALSLLKTVDGSSESVSFLYLLGIDAPPDSDPIEAGRKLYAEYRQAEDNEGYQVNDGQVSNRLVRPNVSKGSD